MAIRHCTVCKQDKPLRDFRSYAKKRRTECRECEKTIQRCTECGALKLLEDFSPSKQKANGKSSHCLLCSNARSKSYHHGNKESISIRKRNRYKSDYKYRESIKSAVISRSKTVEGKKKIQEYNNTPQRKAQHRKYNQTDSRRLQNRINHREDMKRRWADPARRLKVKARQSVNFAVMFGFFKRPDVCQSGGKYHVPCSEGKISGHHHKGYDRENWLEIEWLCPACHREADKQQKAANA